VGRRQQGWRWECGQTLLSALCSLLLFLLCLASCHAQRRSSADFYEGLKKKQAEAKTEAVSCFEKALDDPNIHISAASAVELMSLHYSGTDIPTATLVKIRKKAPALIASQASGSWAKALDALGAGQNGPDREKVLALALNSANRPPDEAVQYLLLELRLTNAVGPAIAAANAANADNADPVGEDSAVNTGIFTNAENAAIAGRIAVSHSRYREALIFFRLVTRDQPVLFFQYPELLGDLGRAFQYTSTGREGIDLFLEWERNFNGDKDLEALVRYRLLFYSARIARQQGGTAQGGGLQNIELFEHALPWALLLPPQTRAEQIDACVWYILNSSLSQEPGKTIKYLEKYIQYWQDDSYYCDVMDKLARGLLLKRQWAEIINIFALVKNRPGVIGAKFAWIIGRAIQEGLLPAREMERARAELHSLGIQIGAEATAEAQVSKAYIRAAYNNAPIFDSRALYYRSLSAAALGEKFLTTEITEFHGGKDDPGAKTPRSSVSSVSSVVNSSSSKAKTQSKAAPKSQVISPDDSETMQFMLGFFKNNAAKFAPRYIRMMESGLSPEDMLRLAEALGNGTGAPKGGAPNGAGQYQESMRLASLAVRQAGYQPGKKDLELLYPRPFIEQASRAAQETGIDPANLYSLMRTESAFHPDAISRAGAIGLTQLMPATAEEMAARIRRLGGPDYTRKIEKDSVGSSVNGDETSGATDADVDGRLIANEVSVDLLDPGANIHMGAAYLAYLEERMGDPLLALLAYNGGMNRVRRWRNSTPAKFPPDLFLETVEYAETMEYGRAVIGGAAMYKSLYYDYN
jgi:soluble lytic murein transglycosylase